MADTVKKYSSYRKNAFSEPEGSEKSPQHETEEGKSRNQEHKDSRSSSNIKERKIPSFLTDLPLVKSIWKSRKTSSRSGKSHAFYSKKWKEVWNSLPQERTRLLSGYTKKKYSVLLNEQEDDADKGYQEEENATKDNETSSLHLQDNAVKSSFSKNKRNKNKESKANKSAKNEKKEKEVNYLFDLQENEAKVTKDFSAGKENKNSKEKKKRSLKKRLGTFVLKSCRFIGVGAAMSSSVGAFDSGLSTPCYCDYGNPSPSYYGGYHHNYYQSTKHTAFHSTISSTRRSNIERYHEVQFCPFHSIGISSYHYYY